MAETERVDVVVRLGRVVVYQGPAVVQGPDEGGVRWSVRAEVDLTTAAEMGTYRAVRQRLFVEVRGQRGEAVVEQVSVSMPAGPHVALLRWGPAPALPGNR